MADSTQTVSQGSFYFSSAAHMGALQSHQVVPVDAKYCKEADAMRLSQPENAGNEWQYFSLPDTRKCFKIEEKKGAWNDTPYWIMEVPSDIIPDHGTIFTGRFMAMLQNLVPTNAQVKDSEPPEKRMKQATQQ